MPSEVEEELTVIAVRKIGKDKRVYLGDIIPNAKFLVFKRNSNGQIIIEPLGIVKKEGIKKGGDEEG